MTTKDRIHLEMSVAEIAMAMSEVISERKPAEGKTSHHPGAAQVCLRILQQRQIPKIWALGSLQILYDLDLYKIYDLSLWDLYLDVCKENVHVLFQAILLVHFGKMTLEDLKTLIAEKKRFQLTNEQLDYIKQKAPELL